MNRKQFLKKSGFGCCAWLALDAGGSRLEASQQTGEEVSQVQRERDFLRGWLADLVDAMDTHLDSWSKVRLMEACGRRCFERHDFKQNIARQGKDDLKKLLEAYKKNFECWQEGNLVHIRYGEVSSRCYCPAANYRPSKANDIHCECTRNTHQTVFETALGRPFKVDIVESLRRGGKTCHFVVHLT
ncbi:MAG: hypothetical protein LAP13_19835 [Acidobacteriia bacterium]|nr:hypothetical protein [Terriglobia bacterium]